MFPPHFVVPSLQNLEWSCSNPRLQRKIEPACDPADFSARKPFSLCSVLCAGLSLLYCPQKSECRVVKNWGMYLLLVFLKQLTILSVAWVSVSILAINIRKIIPAAELPLVLVLPVAQLCPRDKRTKLPIWRREKGCARFCMESSVANHNKSLRGWKQICNHPRPIEQIE